MLLIDRKLLMFAKKTKGTLYFFYTDDKFVIQSYMNYFFKIENEN